MIRFASGKFENPAHRKKRGAMDIPCILAEAFPLYFLYAFPVIVNAMLIFSAV